MDIKKISDIPTISSTSNQDKLLTVTSTATTKLITLKDLVRTGSLILPLRFSGSNVSSSIDTYYDNGDHTAQKVLRALRGRVVYRKVSTFDASNYWRVRFVDVLGDGSDQGIWGVNLDGAGDINTIDQPLNIDITSRSPLLAVKLQKNGNPSNVTAVSVTVYLGAA